MEQVRKVIHTAWSMFRRFGVRSVSMDDVAREMSMSKKTLYRCFSDKNELIAQTLEHDMTEMEKHVNSIFAEEPNPVKQVIRIAHYIAKYLGEVNHSMIYDLQKYHGDIYHKFEERRRQTFQDKVLRNLEAGISQGFYHTDLNPLTSAQLYLCLMNHGTEYLIQSQPDINIGKLYLQVIKYHLHAITTPKGLEEAKDFLNDNNL